MGNAESVPQEEGGQGQGPGRGQGQGRRDEDDGPNPDEVDPENMSYWQMFKVGKEMLVASIIRPPRAEYDADDLGPSSFAFCDTQFTRTDLELVNPRGQKLQCSWWRPSTPPASPQPCVVYLHGNASCRAEATSVLCVVLSLGATLFSLDLSGSGQSEGEYISLGFYERDDVHTVVEHLRGTGTVSTIGLWGRSMGAATALLHGDRDPSIACMVLDSPFADLTQLARELVDTARGEGFTVPAMLVSVALRHISSQVKSRAHFDIKDLSPIAHAHECFIPALFAHARDDDFIQPHHSRQIFDRYAGDKNMIEVEGDHGSERPEFFHASAGIFLQNRLQIPESSLLPGSQASPSSPHPPWAFSHLSALGIHRHARPTPGMLAARGYGAEMPPEMVGPGNPHDWEQGVVAVESLEEEMVRQAIAASLGESPARGAVRVQSPPSRPAQQPQPQSQPPPRRVVVEADEQLCESLRQMGFSDHVSREALVRANNDLPRAIDLAVSGTIPEQPSQPTPPRSSEAPPNVPPNADVNASAGAPPQDTGADEIPVAPAIDDQSDDSDLDGGDGYVIAEVGDDDDGSQQEFGRDDVVQGRPLE